MDRRDLIRDATHMCAGLLAAPALATQAGSGPAASPQRFLLIGLNGSENPTRANFPFVWAVALRDAGHEVRIELAGDATVLMRDPVANSVTPVGWPPFREALAKVVEHKIPIFV